MVTRLACARYLLLFFLLCGWMLPAAASQNRLQVVLEHNPPLSGFTDNGRHDGRSFALHPGEPFRFQLWIKGALLSAVVVFAGILLHNWRLRRIVKQKAVDLAEQSYLYRGVFNSTPDLQGVLSPEGILLYANQASLDFAGTTTAEVTGKPFWETPWWSHGQICREKLRQMIKRSAAGEKVTTETEHVNAAGEVRIIDFTLHPLFDDDGKLLYLIPVGRDITRRKEYEHELKERNRFLDTLFNAMPFNLWVRDREGRLLMQNQLNAEQYGAQLGSTIQESMQSDHLKTLWTIHLEQAFQGVPFDLEVREGDRILRRVIAPIDGARGIEFCFGFDIDMTERYQMLDQLRESERRFKALFDEIPFIVTLKDPDTTEYLDVNRFFCEFNQVCKSEVIGKRPPEIARFIDEEQHNLIATIMKQVGKIDLHEITLQRPDGAKRVGILSCRTIRLDGKPCNLTVIQDITSLKEAEAELLRSKDRERSLLVQHEKMLMIGGLAAGMAHEINNPTGIIAHELQNLERRISPDLAANRAVAADLGLDIKQIGAYLNKRSIPEFIENINQATRRISHIIASMLNFSRQDTSALRPADINKIVQHSIELASSDYELRNQYDFRDVSITTELAERLPQVSVIITEIEQVLINLIKNAVQAMYQQKRERRIQIFTSATDGWVKVAVDDSGPGIPAGLRSRIFEPFFTTKEVGKGTGLGLAVSYAIIVNHHQGRLEVQSLSDGGTSFLLYLPARQVNEQ